MPRRIVNRCIAVLLFLVCIVLSGCTEAEPEDAPVEKEPVTEVLQQHSGPGRIGLVVADDLSAGLESQRTKIEEISRDTVTSCITYTPWYRTSRLIYHAGGSVSGMEYTNSKEAVELTLSRGNRLLEIDFLFTSDGHLVCLHEWKNFYGMASACTLEQFLSLRIFENFTTISAAQLISYMRQYPDMYIIVDTKESDTVSVVAELLRLCSYDAEIADRFVIQLYDAGIKAKVCELYGFRNDNFLFTAYNFGPSRISEILELCREEEIRVITVPYGAWDNETVARFAAEGYLIFEHTVNFTKMTKSSLARGVYGFYTDFLRESDLGLPEEA